MADRNRRAGLLRFNVNGVQMEAKGDFTVQSGEPIREAIIGADGVHGYKETAQVAFVEGAITDSPELNTKALKETTNATITLNLNNQKTWLLEDAWYAGEGSMTTGEGEIAVRFESKYPATEI